jgi:hypothetical protein
VPWFYGHGQEGTGNESTKDKLYCTKPIAHAQQRTQMEKSRWCPQIGRKYLQSIALIKGLYPKYIRNSYNSITRKQ